MVGEPEDVADLAALIRADIESGAEPQSAWLVQALVSLDRARAEPILLGLLRESKYEMDATWGLCAALEEKMLGLGGYRTEGRGYTPHLTLGRVRAEADGAAVAGELQKRLAWNGGRVAVGEVLVYSSEAERDGPVYTVIGRAPLAG